MNDEDRKELDEALALLEHTADESKITDTRRGDARRMVRAIFEAAVGQGYTPFAITATGNRQERRYESIGLVLMDRDAYEEFRQNCADANKLAESMTDKHIGPFSAS